MTTEEVMEKYRILAGKVISAEAAAALQEKVQNLEKLADVRELNAEHVKK